MDHELTNPLTKQRRAPSGSCFLVSIAVLSAFCNGIFLNVRGPCVHDLSVRTGITASQMGWFFIASGVGGVASALPAGKLIDYLGNPMTTLCAGLMVRSVSCFLLPYVSTPAALLGIGVVQGMTLPLVGVSLRASILWTYRRNATPYLNLVMAAFGAGSTLAPLLYDYLAVITPSSAAPLDWTFWGLACFSALLSGASLCVDRKRFERAARRKKRREDKRRRHGGERRGPRGPGRPSDTISEEYLNGGGDDDDDPLRFLEEDEEEDEVDEVEKDEERRENLLPDPPSFRQSIGFFGILTMYMAVSVGIEGTLGSWIYTLAGGNKINGFSTATWINASLWASFTMTRLLLFAVSNRITEKTILQLSHACVLAGLITACTQFTLSAAPASGGVQEVTYPPWSLWVLTISFGIGISPSFPNIMGLASKLYPWAFTGTIQSTFGIAANAGNGALPGLAGLLTEWKSVGSLAFVYVPLIGVCVMQILLLMLYCWKPKVDGGRRS